MFPKTQNTAELLSLAISQELYIVLIKQLNKDFQLSNIDEGFPESITPSNLRSQLFTFINKLIQKDFDLFLNLLYRIDLPESQAIRALNQTFEDYIEMIVFAILKRECQKIWLKKKFS